MSATTVRGDATPNGFHDSYDDAGVLAARAGAAMQGFGATLPVGAFGLTRLLVTGTPTLAIVLADGLLPLTAAVEALAPEHADLGHAADVGDLLPDWDTTYDRLADIVEMVLRAGLGDERLAPSVRDWGQDRVLAPVARPSKMLNAAQNYPDHVEEMRVARGRGFGSGAIDESADFTGVKASTRPYLFLKAPSAITGPFDDIVLPRGMSRIDWEVELAVVIGRRSRGVTGAAAVASIAGYMATNDVSCRDLLFRPDRDRLRSDWLGGKSHDGFAPMGPVFVPRAFVPDHGALRLQLSVNGEPRQDGNTGHLIFSPEEQIAFVSEMTTLEPGDIFATGTPGGVGQGTDTFLQPGDVVEARVGGLGLLRNTFVAAD